MKNKNDNKNLINGEEKRREGRDQERRMLFCVLIFSLLNIVLRSHGGVD
mgnify:CR=1 FL=1